MATQAVNTAPTTSYEDLKKKIFSQRGAGTYGEGTIGTAVQTFKDLENQLNSGAISQSDYVALTKQLAPDVQQYIASIAGQGSKQANAAKAAGMDTFNNDILRNVNIYGSGREMLGRDITANELAQLKPRFAGENGLETGRAYLATLAEQDKTSPQNLATKAKGYSTNVGGMFKDLLGRDATAEESDYYGRLLAQDVTPYEVQSAIKNTQEYQGNADTKFRGGLKDELMGYNTKAFDKAKEGILSRYQKAGDGVGQSSDLNFAMANALGELNTGTDQFLSNISSSQYGGNKDNARADYQGMLDQFIKGKNYDQTKSDAYLSYLTQRADQGSDYERQMRDYMAMLNKQPKKKNGTGQMVGSLIGTGVGAYYGGPAGAGAGAQAGGAAGGLYDNLLA